MWDGCSDVLRRRLDALHGRTLMLIFPDTILTAGQKLKEMRIMSLHKQLEYKLVCSYTRSLTMRPQSLHLTCTHPPSRKTISRNHNNLWLPRPRIDIFQTSVAFSDAFLWNNLQLTVRSYNSVQSSFKRKRRVHLEAVK